MSWSNRLVSVLSMMWQNLRLSCQHKLTVCQSGNPVTGRGIKGKQRHFLHSSLWDNSRLLKAELKTMDSILALLALLSRWVSVVCSVEDSVLSVDHLGAVSKLELIRWYCFFDYWVKKCKHVQLYCKSAINWGDLKIRRNQLLITSSLLVLSLLSNWLVEMSCPCSFTPVLSSLQIREQSAFDSN